MGEFMDALTGLFAVTMPVWIIWIIFHYRSVNRSREGMSQDDAKHLEELLEIADTMAERIKTLESILDDETPEWRERVRQIDLN